MEPRQLAAILLADITGGDTIEAAIREGRCIQPPAGCGKSIPLVQDAEGRRMPGYDFPSEAYKNEWKLTGFCSSCQDILSLDQGDDSTIVLGLD